MNPVLSSTIDFDQYINDALNGRPNRPSSASNSGRLSSSKTTSSTDARNSSNIMELNSKKFSLNKRPTSSSGNNQLKPSEDILDVLNMTHSWKAHLSSTHSRGGVNSNNRYQDSARDMSELSEGIASLNVKLPTPVRSKTKPKFSVDEEFDEPLPNPPLIYNKQLQSPGRPVAVSSTSHSPARSSSRSLIIDEEVATATESLHRYREKTNTMLQTKYFRSWQIETKLSKGLLHTRSKIVARNVASGDWLLKLVLRDWWNLCKAVQFSEKYTRYLARKWIRRLLNRANRKNNQSRYAVSHYQRWRKFKGLRALYINYQHGRRLKKKHRVRHEALQMRRRHLLQSMMTTWKKLVRKSRGSRHIIEEQIRRQEKIKQFVSKITSVRSAHEGDAAASETAAAEAKGLRKTPSIHTATVAAAVSAAGSSSSVGSNRAQSAGSARKSGIPSGGGKPPLSGRTTAGAATAGGRGASGRPSTASATAPHVLEPLQVGDQSTPYDEDVFEQYDSEGGGGSSEGEVTPPPSFRTFLREEQEEAEREAFEKSSKSGGGVGGSSSKSPPPAAAAARDGMRSNNWTGNAATRGNTGGATTTAAGTAAAVRGPSDFEARAAERRLKAAALRKAAENRVSLWQKELEAQEKERLAKEAKEAETIRKNSRLRIEQNKQNAVKLMENSEQMKRMLQTAKNFYHMHLLIQFGFGPWRRFIDQIRIDTAKAVQFYYDHLLQSTWSALVGYVVMMRTERYKREHRLIGMATAKYRRNLARRMWRRWKLWHKMLKAKAKSVTGHFSRFTLFRRAFQGWKIAFERSQRYTAKRMMQVAPLGRLRALRYYWTSWKEFHESRLFDREVRYRVDDKWAKIQSWMNKK